MLFKVYYLFEGWVLSMNLLLRQMALCLLFGVIAFKSVELSAMGRLSFYCGTGADPLTVLMNRERLLSTAQSQMVRENWQKHFHAADKSYFANGDKVMKVVACLAAVIGLGLLTYYAWEYAREALKKRLQTETAEKCDE